MAENNATKKSKMYTVHLPKSDYEDAKLVIIDGKNYLVKRGMHVEVPEAVYKELHRSELAEQAAEDHAEELASRGSAELK